MAIRNRWNIILLIFMLMTQIWGKPKCRRRFMTDVVCVAGTDDYILIRGLVSDNNNTFAIKLKDCRITEVNIEAFKNNYGLEEIDLSRNKITSLKTETFYGNPKLRKLNLSQNLLTILPLGIFDRSPRLQHFDINVNTISSLQIDLFKHAAGLLYLGLLGNAIVGKDMSPSFFKNIPNLLLLDLSGNDMSQSPHNLLQDLRKLNELDLNGCSLTEVPEFATRSNLNTLKRLSSHTNNITKIDDPDTFSNLENLEILGLSRNEINNLHADVIKPLKKLKLLDLSFNKIERIPENFFREMIKLRTVYLSYNSIDSVPLNAFYGTRLKTLRLNANRLTFLDSNFCAELRKSSNWLTNFEFDENPFQCACLLEILTEVKKFGIVYNSDKYDGEQPVCFMSSEFSCMRQTYEFEYDLDVRRLPSHIPNKNK